MNNERMRNGVAIAITTVIWLAGWVLWAELGYWNRHDEVFLLALNVAAVFHLLSFVPIHQFVRDVITHSPP